MSKYIPGNQKHLTLEDRIYIENELNKGTSFKDIARFLCKDPTTISKEIRAHRLSERKAAPVHAAQPHGTAGADAPDPQRQG